MENNKKDNKIQIKNHKRPAILVIDMQNDFVKGKLKCDRADKIVLKIKHLLDNARARQIPIRMK
jgi:nicotinamidase-related amidase